MEGFEFDSRSGFSMFKCSLEPRGIFQVLLFLSINQKDVH